jgi:flagellar biosynthesis/type III secretory pathway chaperone
MENGMDQLLNDLGDCMDRQLTLYRHLLDLFHGERKAILSSDLETLNQVLMDKETLLQQIRREEVQRRKVAGQLARQHGMAAGDLTITRLSTAFADHNGVTEVKKRGAELQALTDEIQIESERNRSLCLHALQFVSNSLKLLSTLTRPNQVYQASGRVQNGGPMGRMLSGTV